MHNGHECVQVIRQDLSSVRVVSRRIRGPYHANCTHPNHHRASTSLNNPLLTCRVHELMRLSPYPYTFISSIQLETRLVRPGNMFPVINSLMWVLTGFQARCKASRYAENKST
ncbi:uncharacterized protein TNCV_150741 [Trichonephila clavipes]|nr:uncharacterized protein TNCV_150741 [Trichonephila clavipes]